MEDSRNEYLSTRIKVEVEDVPLSQEDQSVGHVWVDGQNSVPSLVQERPVFDQESYATNFAETFQPSPQFALVPTMPTRPVATSPSINPYVPVTTKCSMRNCKWSTKSRDKDVIFLLMKYHASASHKLITDICDVCFAMFESKDQLNVHIRQTHGSFQCRFCLFQLSSQLEMEAHFKKMHNIHNVEQYNNIIKSLMIPSTSIVKPQPVSTLQNANFVVNYPNPTVINPNSIVTVQNSTVLVSNSTLNPNSTFRAEASTVNPNSTVIVSNSTPKTYSRAKASTVNPILTVKNPISIAKDPNSTVTIPNSTLKVTNSTLNAEKPIVKDPNSTVKVTNSTLNAENSIVIPPDFSVKNENFIVNDLNSSVKDPNSGVKNFNSIVTTENFNVETPLESPGNEATLSNNDSTLSKHTYTCHLCNCKFFTSRKLTNHMVQFHTVLSDINMEKITFTGPAVRKLACKQCYSLFMHLDSLIQHYLNTHKHNIPKLVDKNKKYVEYMCTECGIYTFDILCLESHYLTAHGKEMNFRDFDLSHWYMTMVKEMSLEENKLIFTCTYCSDFYSSNNDLNQHTIKVHQKYACSKCKMKFDSVKEELDHSDEVHVGYCKICDFKTHNSAQLLNHLFQRHPGIKPVDDPSIYRVKKSTGDSYHTCKLCQKSLSSVQTTKMHYYWFHYKYVCTFCNETFQNAYSESYHYMSNHSSKLDEFENKYFVCEKCGEDLKCHEKLSEHREKHDENLNGFQREIQLNFDKERPGRTVEWNRGEYCKICKKKVKNFGAHLYFIHGLTARNLEDNKLRCNICRKMFYVYSKLRNHLACHRKFKCDHCTMQFNFIRHLEEHVVELHTNRCTFSCPDCHRLYATAVEFGGHRKLKDCKSEPELVSVLHCGLCQFFCQTRNCMEDHMESEHISAKDGSLINVKPRRK